MGPAQMQMMGRNSAVVHAVSNAQAAIQTKPNKHADMDMPTVTHTDSRNKNGMILISYRRVVGLVTVRYDEL